MYADLARLLGGYLHQDFPEEYGSADGAVRAFAEDGPERVDGAAAEIGGLLDEDRSDADLAALLTRLGSCHRPESDGHTPRSWLAHVRELLTAAARDFAVHLDPAGLDRTRSGLVTGGIWVRAAGVAFPCPGWSDFPVALAAGWLTGLAAGGRTLRFMEGPYELRLAPAQDGRATLTATAEGAAEPALVTAVDPAAVTRAVRRAAVVLLTSCRARGWNTEDIRYLSARLTD